jgi:hypothetical protein
MASQGIDESSTSGGEQSAWKMPSAQPNNMTYRDGDGVEHSIYLPQGTMHQACDHFDNKRWDELAKFEPYGKLL